MNEIEKKLIQLGYTLPEVPTPIAKFVPSVRVDNLIYISGQGPAIKDELIYTGHVGKELTLEQAQECARICVLNCLAVIKKEIGDLDKIKKIVKLLGFVNSAPGFNLQAQVINGASELLTNILGERGVHARSAVGVAELPIDTPVEIEMIIAVRQ